MSIININLTLKIILFAVVQLPNTDELLSAVRNAYETNLVNISYGMLRFDYTVGRATDFEAVGRDEWAKTAVAPGLFAIDGSRIRYEHIFSPEDTVKHRRRIGERSWTSNLHSVRLLTDGVVTLSDVIQIASDDQTVVHTSSIDSGFDIFPRLKVLPLDIGLVSMERDRISAILSSAVDGKIQSYDIQYPSHNTDDERIVELTFKAPRSTVVIAFDLERGAVPRAMQSISDGRVTTAFVFDSVSQCGPDTWLPFRMLSYHDGGIVREIVIREASFENPPPRSTFQIEYPEPVPMLNKAESVAYLPRQIWRLDDLPLPGSREAPRVSIRSIVDMPPSAQLSERESSLSSYYSIGLFALGGTLIVIASRMVIRKRR